MVLNGIEIEGEETRVEAVSSGTNVECLAPFAVNQIIQGPVDSMGAYFRCKAEGQLLTVGDDTESVKWVGNHQKK